MGEYYGSMLRSFYSKKVRSKPVLFLDYLLMSYSIKEYALETDTQIALSQAFLTNEAYT